MAGLSGQSDMDMDSDSDAKSNIKRDPYQEDDEDSISLASIPLTPSKRQRPHPHLHSHSQISISSSPVKTEQDDESLDSAAPSTLKSNPHSPSPPPPSSSTHQDDPQNQPPKHEAQNDHLQDDITFTTNSHGGTNDDPDADPDADPHRPNRWNGPTSTWMAWTAADRQAWYALEGVRRGDLSAHLFNALGLRRGFRFRRAGEGNEEDSEEVGEADGDGAGAGLDDVDVDGGWEPGKGWTAWPMRAAEVPQDGLMPRAVDVNEPFTFRKEEPGRQAFVGRNLEEEISAGMLRCAAEKFRRRGLGGRLQGATSSNSRTGGNGEGIVMKSVESNDGVTTGGETDLDVGETTGRDDETDAAPSFRRNPRRGKRRGATSGAASPSFTPTLSVDDERSYALLRPAARQIMSRLDATLMILHNQRMAGLGNLSESSAGDEDETDEEDGAVKGVSRELPRKPPRKSSSIQTPTTQPQPTKRGPGRPRIERVLLEGETEHQMRARIARRNKKKVPVLSMASGSEPGGETEGSRNRSRGPSKTNKRQLSKGRSNASSPASSRASSRSRGSSVSSETNREKLLGRWGLRNWKDVLSAAALAGFPPKVIARATQRCSTLFRQEITMHTLHPQSTSGMTPSSRMAGIETARYVPGQPIPSSSEEDGDSDRELQLAQLRAVNRRSSVKPTSEISSSESESEPDNTRAGRQPQHHRSGSATPTTPLLSSLVFCPHRGCRRSIEPFNKKSNLERHLQAVHDNRTPDPTEPAYQAVEDSGYKRRRRSATPGLAAHLCPHPKCPRAIEGFTKRTNLTRHLQTTHGGYLPGGGVLSSEPRSRSKSRSKSRSRSRFEDSEWEGRTEDDEDEDGEEEDEDEEKDSADEMEGGIHVDRFLQPIKFRKGWRAEDMRQRQRMGRSVKRARMASEELDSFL